MSKWQSGQSGNPNGRPPGVGEAAKLRAAIAAEVPGILDKLTDLARSGDVQAARLLLERVLPPVKAVEATVEVSMLAGTLTEKAVQLLSAAAAGDLAPGQAAALISSLGNIARIAETDDLLRRIERLEQVTVRNDGKRP